MIINHNIAALNTHRQLGSNNAQASKNLEKLSSGLQINRAGDDAAGLAISEKMRGQIRGLDMAAKNAQDGISLIQTAEGALNETHSILQRMRELAVQSSNDTNTDTDRAELQKEVNQLTNAINDISKNTEFNTKSLLDGSFKGTFHVGANSGQNLEVEINKMGADALKVAGKDAAVFSQSATAVTAGTIANGDYTVVSADNYSGIALTDSDTSGGAAGSAAAQKYIMVGADGNAVATSADGKVFKEYGGAGALTGTFTLTETAANNATVTKSAAGVTAEVGVTGTSNNLQTGSYKVVDLTNNPTYGATYQVGLADASGKIVGLGTDGTDPVDVADIADVTNFVSVDDTSKTMLAVGAGHGLAVEGSINVTGSGIDISSQKSADAAIKTIQSAIDNVSAERSKLGAVQNRLDHTINNLGTSSENLTAAESRIRDVDMAKEMMDFTKNNILTQAAQAMLAQANQQPQGVLQLLR